MSLFWDCVERRARCAVIVKTHIYTNRYISARLLSALTLWFHLSIPQTEHTSGSVFSPSLCLCVCIPLPLIKEEDWGRLSCPLWNTRKRRRGALSLIGRESQNIISTWRRTNAWAATQSLEAGCMQSGVSLHAANAQCFSFLTWKFRFRFKPLFWSQSGAMIRGTPVTVLAD